MARGHILQDPFLNALRRQRVPVSVYLTNGIKLSGHVVAFDQYVLLLKNNNTKQMVYKHAIATVVPSRNVAWHDMDGAGESGPSDSQDGYGAQSSDDSRLIDEDF